MPDEPLPESISFDPKRMLLALAMHQVDFIVIGGIAAIFHASPFATFDLDICPADDDANLRRLGDALIELEARMRFTDEPEPIRIDFSPRILRAAQFLNLTTKWGPLDIVHSPGGTRGFEDLRRDATVVELEGVGIVVASRADVLRSKEAIYRDKDVPTVRLFRELEERDLREKESRKKRPPGP